jgi:hypothetical protein
VSAVETRKFVSFKLAKGVVEPSLYRLPTEVDLRVQEITQRAVI